MKRDPIAEWKNALRKRGSGFYLRSIASLRVLPVAAHQLVPWPDSAGTDRDLGATRRLFLANPAGDEFATTVRLLQRHNKLVQTRFGVGWPDAAIVMLAEAHRRGVSVSAMTRQCIADLRGTAQGGGAHAV